MRNWIWFFDLFRLCPFFDSRCWRNLFWSVDIFSPDLNDFSFNWIPVYLCFFILFWSTSVRMTGFFLKDFSLFDSFLISFWFLWFCLTVSYVFTSLRFCKFYKICFTFYLWVCKDLIFQLLESCILSFHFCHKWFDRFLLCCLISSLLYIWYHMLFHFATRNIVQTK